MTKVREDEKGLYVIAGGWIARPGVTEEYAHTVKVDPNFRMNDAGLKSGDTVKARHLSQTHLTKIHLDNGVVLHWSHDGLSPEFRRGRDWGDDEGD